MSNRFETPIASEFINTYVPIPFKEMMAAGQAKQQRYDAGAAAQDSAIQRLESISAIAGTEDDAYRRKAIQQMYDIRDRYVGKDLSDSFVLRQMNNDINSNIDKEWLQKMGESKVAWDMNQKNRMGLAADNKLNNELDLMRDPTLANKAAGRDRSWNSKEMGTYNYASRAFTDKSTLFKPYYDNVAPDISRIIDEDGYSQQVYGISDNKIKAVSDAGAQELASTPQGKDYIDSYIIAHPETKLDGVQILQKEMYDYGKPYAKTEKRVLAASLQDPNGGSSKKSHTFQDIMTNVMGAQDTVAGTNDNQKIETINKEYDAAKAQLVINKDDPNAIGIVSKIDESRKLGELAARKETDLKIAKLKKEALTKMKAIPEFSQIPDGTINKLIDDQFAPGFSAGAARFGNALHQGEDIVFGSGPRYLLEAVTNIGSSLVQAGINKISGKGTIDPNEFQSNVEQIVKEDGVSENPTLGEILGTGMKAIKRSTWNNTTDLTSSIQKRRDKDERNILRDVVKGVNNLEKEIKDATDQYVLGQMQHMASKKQLYPIVTTDVGNGEEITSSNGDKFVSNTARVLQNLPITMSGFEVRELGKKGKYDVLNDAGAKNMQLIAATWDKLPGSFVEAMPDDSGNTILHVAYTTPKGQGTPSLKQYEIKLPFGSDEANKVASDFEGLNTIDGNIAAMKLKNPFLKREINSYIDVPEGHDYKIYHPAGVAPTLVNVKRESGEYIIRINGEKAEPRKYKEEVIDALYKLQASAALGK